ncbi:MAG TPA: transcription antitermination factor NusB [Vicinamibacterales bacterium]|nr:transcription antitermination factor NusB [Vicinamibacterales bacterium]
MTALDGVARHAAREAALQMLYQWEVGRASAEEAFATYWPSRDPDGAVPGEARAFANGLVRATIAHVAEADGLIAAHARNWRLERMAVIDRLVLRLGIAELLADPATPATVVINEALELARTFSGEEPVPFINGVLDAVRKTLKRA